MTTNPLPIAIIGAGPVGLAAAAHLVERGLPFVVLEAGAQVGQSVRAWGHVQMFSPWRYTVDAAAARLLETTGWPPPDPEGFPTGHDLVTQYLVPLAAHPAIAPHIRVQHQVVGVSRVGVDKLKTEGREQAPFLLHLRTPAGQRETVLARAVIDASGTSTTPNPLGASGLPALGELELAAQIVYGIPDVLGAARARYAGKRVLVAGSGHSAFNALLDLATLAAQVPSTHITWVVRRGALDRALGGGEHDELPARGRLGQRVRGLLAQGTVQLVTGWHTDRLEQTPDGIVVSAGDRSLPPVDAIIVATGLRPDLAMLRELRLGLDPLVEAPTHLAPLIDPNLHSCGTVPPHGADELAHPEPNFYLIGMKSYGRAPTFLLMTGYEQARSVVAALAGDWEAARRVELVLPETGVCSGPGGGAGGCCAPTRTTQPSDVPVLPQAVSLIALTPTGTGAPTCCAETVQATCCAPEDKGACCGAEPAATCGCQ